MATWAGEKSSRALPGGLIGLWIRMRRDAADRAGQAQKRSSADDRDPRGPGSRQQGTNREHGRDWILSPEKERLPKGQCAVAVRGGSGVAIGRRVLRRFAELIRFGGLICFQAAELG